MKWLLKTLKVLSITLLSIVVLVIGYYVKARYSLEERQQRKYVVVPESLELNTDSAHIAEGYRLTAIKGCRDCHGDDLGGKMFTDDAVMGTLAARNLTKGSGGLPPNYNIDDWVRALKHGVGRDSTALLVMPSHKFAKLSQRDMEAIIAYCTRLPEIDRSFPKPYIGPLTTILTDLGEIDLFPAELIDHNAPLVKTMTPEISISYGKYLSMSCTGCHQENMKGGKPLGPGSPIPADLTKTGNPGKWSDEQFITTMRTGKTPEGKSLDAKYMPWPMAKSYTDVELKALKMYLKSLN